ncbi:hypothetical protein [Leucobacter chironomi]|uniref:hypothetical protein n=1 Tax=Leucobacter chironomi TaxID=491918 RepID=UPI000425D571|nr:hypothetical protein [Leucobacter chironomi]
MTIKLHATVRRRFEVHPLGYDRGFSPWIARAYINGVPQYRRTATAESHPEAVQAAYKLLADLDRDLMAEVHESRASRRPRCECGPGLLHSYHCPRHERHEVTEPTA